MRTVKAGSTNVSVDLYIIDSSDGTPETDVLWNTAGIDLKYRREGAAAVSITEAVLTTPALTDSWESGGFLEIGNGSYRLDVPDAAFAAGADKVTIFGTITGMIVIPVEIQLVAYDPEDAVRLGLTALPNAAADAAGGLPISDAGGLDLDTKLANTNEVTAARMGALTDWIDGGRLDLILDIIAADTTTDIPALIATAQADLDIITGATGVNLLDATQASIDAIEADTNELQGDWANAGRLDAILDIIAADTTTDIPALIATAEGKIDTIDGIVDDILVDTAEIGAAGAGLSAVPWNAAWDAEVQSEVTDSLVAHNLDHLCLTATVAADMTAEVADNTIVSRILANGDTSAFDPSTDNVTAIFDNTAAILTDTGTTLQNDITAILDDTNSTLDTLLDEIKAAVITNAAGADIAADIIALKAETALILADTGTDGVLLAATATSAQLVDDIWDEDVDSSHQTAGTAGKKLDDAGAAADPWSTALPGAYGAGTAGYIIGTNLDDQITDVKDVVDDILIDTSTTLQNDITAIRTDTETTLDGLIDSIYAAVITNAAGADIAADIIALKAETTLILADTGTDGVLLAATATSAQLVDDIWDEDVDSSHQTAGTAGKKLDAAGTASDPWATSLPGAYGAGTAGNIIGNIVDDVWDETMADHVGAGTTGYSLNAAGVAADPWDTALPGAYIAGTAGNIIGNSIAAILADTNELQTDDIPTLIAALPTVTTIWAAALPGAFTAGQAGYIIGTNLDAAISSIGGSTGSGAIEHTITVNTVGGDPIDNVKVWVSTDAAGTNVVAGTLRTDSNGEVEFMLDAGTYYSWREHGGYNFTNPQTETVA